MVLGYFDLLDLWMFGFFSDYVLHADVLYFFINVAQALGLKTPRFVSMSITTLQISQMVFGIYINVLTYFSKGLSYFIKLKYCSSIFVSTI